MNIIKNLGGRPRKPGGKGANKHCVFGNCKNDSRKNESDYQFIRFPKPSLEVRKQFIIAKSQHKSICDACQKCNRWIIMCKRRDGNFKSLSDVKKDTYICTKHFVKLELTDIYPDPLPEDVVYKLNNHSRKRKWMSQPDAENTKAVKTDNEEKNEVDAVAEDFVNTVEVEAAKANAVTDEIPTPTVNTKATQTTFCLKDSQVLQKKIENLKKHISLLTLEIQENRMEQFERDIQNNETMCKFYTNLCFKQILHLIAFLDIPCNINYWGETTSTLSTTSKKLRKKKLTIQQQIILTLVRMRTGLLVKDMSFRFQLSEGLISKTFTTWIQYMFQKFNSIRSLMFPSRNKIKESLPPMFKRLRNIRVILDCAEFFCQTPSNFEQQGNLYSQYKSHTTYKVLLGCTPNGAVSFVSDLYEGSISDKELVRQSKLIDLLDDGDLVLADRGFTIKDMTDTKHISLNIPPFLKGRAKLSPEEEMETKRIAKERIYIEHVVGRIKQFRILQKNLPSNMRSIMSQIVFVCACLLNFQEPLVSP